MNNSHLNSEGFPDLFCHVGVSLLLRPVGDPKYVSTLYPTDLNFCHYRLWAVFPYGLKDLLESRNRTGYLFSATASNFHVMSNISLDQCKAEHFSSHPPKPCLETRLIRVFKGKCIQCQACLLDPCLSKHPCPCAQLQNHRSVWGGIQGKYSKEGGLHVSVGREEEPP